ncbi:MAG: acetyl-CoA carboxylase biotin carboxyl carrier protein subunit [Oscillibacter sp.]|nr:acetyl-CoA carboxylase biotin carboxyl carrier protein subunit [Oscillibacter sp.]
MTNQEIYDLMARFDASGLQTLKLSQGDLKIELGKAAPAAVPLAPAAAALPAVPAMPAVEDGAEKKPVISAPLVGTFYAAPDPKQPPFVMAGDRVKKGQTVCLLEAMKTMIEIPAPCECVIEEVLKANGELAAFGEALMRYTPC